MKKWRKILPSFSCPSVLLLGLNCTKKEKHFQLLVIFNLHSPAHSPHLSRVFKSPRSLTFQKKNNSQWILASFSFHSIFICSFYCCFWLSYCSTSRLLLFNNVHHLVFHELLSLCQLLLKLFMMWL